MKTNQIIAIIAIAFIILLAGLTALLLPRFINNPNPFLNQAAIVKFTQPLHADAGFTSPDITEQYHLWLRMEISPETFNEVFKSRPGATLKDAPIKKDEMRSERLVTASVIQDMLVIKGYSAEGPITNTGRPARPDAISESFGGPLRINKVITLSQEKLRSLENTESLANPQTIPGQAFQPQTDIYQTTEGDKALLYIHLESGIKMQKASNTLSLTITYLKNNNAIQSQTLPLFSY